MCVGVRFGPYSIEPQAPTSYTSTRRVEHVMVGCHFMLTAFIWNCWWGLFTRGLAELNDFHFIEWKSLSSWSQMVTSTPLASVARDADICFWYLKFVIFQCLYRVESTLRYFALWSRLLLVCHFAYLCRFVILDLMALGHEVRHHWPAQKLLNPFTVGSAFCWDDSCNETRYRQPKG